MTPLSSELLARQSRVAVWVPIPSRETVSVTVVASPRDISRVSPNPQGSSPSTLVDVQLTYQRTCLRARPTDLLPLRYSATSGCRGRVSRPLSSTCCARPGTPSSPHPPTDSSPEPTGTGNGAPASRCSTFNYPDIVSPVDSTDQAIYVEGGIGSLSPSPGEYMTVFHGKGREGSG